MSIATTAPAASSPLSAVPDERGRFGEYGRRYVPETLMYALDQLSQAYEDAKLDPEFDRQLKDLLRHFVGRPNPLYFAERLTEKCGGARIYFKREDLNHTGAHKINNTMAAINSISIGTVAPDFHSTRINGTSGCPA
jgi:tryptophan synthase beta chain